MSSEPIRRPILRWAGSKRQIIGHLASYWSEEYERYVEPFAGSCSLFFSIAPDRALVGDKNSDLIEAYEVLRYQPRRLYETVRDMPVNKTAYYRVRAPERRTMPIARRTLR